MEKSFDCSNESPENTLIEIYVDTVGPCRLLGEVLHDGCITNSPNVGHHTVYDCIDNLMFSNMSKTESRRTNLESNN